MPPRLALLAVQHPLCYSYSEPIAHTNGSQNGIKSGDPKPLSSLANPETIEDRVRYLYEHQQITNLLNEYAYVLDACMVDHAAAHKWAALFTEDCAVTYPFGSHRGRDGLAQWAMNAETRFYRMLHSSSNVTISFTSENTAHARSALHAICGTDGDDIGKVFQEGGYYYWSFRREDQGQGQEQGQGRGKWRISYLFLDVNWTSGDSLGLNEPGAAD
ncbi:SnoaL-like domain-containing protein [Cladophialophora immunda]|nr:SnoaL-like domain-containing protein [Cladophialophora immunda]